MFVSLHVDATHSLRAAPMTVLPTRRLPSLRVEFLVTFGVLAAAALVVAVGGVVLFQGLTRAEEGALYLSVLIIADVAVFIAFGAYQVGRFVLRPLRDAVDATEAISTGDLARRVPSAQTRELDALAASVNRMTDRLIGDRLALARAEKLASVGRLAAGIAHEIGNPLAAISGYAHVARRELPTGSPSREALDGVERECARIDRIVRGLLDYARPPRTTPVPVDLNEIVRSTIALLADQGVLRHIEVGLELGEPAPILLGEQHDLQQALVNLVLNAADAMGRRGSLVLHTRLARARDIVRAGRRASDHGTLFVGRTLGPRARAWLEQLAGDALVATLVVADSGPGVPPEDAERIFDPFFTTKEPGRGTGLGLAIVHRVVDNLKGTVWVAAAREGGAAFHVLFPVTPAALSAEADRGVSSAAAHPPVAARVAAPGQ